MTLAIIIAWALAIYAVFAHEFGWTPDILRWARGR